MELPVDVTGERVTVLLRPERSGAARFAGLASWGALCQAAGVADVVSLLPARLRRQTSTALPDRLAGSRDLWQRHLIALQHGPAVADALPAGVVRPSSAEDVALLVELARREGIPLVPYGAGSGVCGAIAPDARTLIVDTKRMRTFERRGDVLSVGPGALGVTLEEALGRLGVTIGHFPSSILCSTVGGWVAARGAGQCSGRYGKIEDMLVAADSVLGTGERVTFHRRAGGLDLTPLLVGSEGTLGILTRVELRLHPIPEARAFSAFELPHLAAGLSTLRRIYQAGLRPAVARLYDPLDSVLLKATAPAAAPPFAEGPIDPDRHVGVTRWLGAPKLLEGALGLLERTVMSAAKLVLVFEGRHGEVDDDALSARTIAREEGGTALGEEPARVWFERRYAVSYEQSRVFRHQAFSDTLEVAAPWSQVGALYHGVRRALARHALVMAHLSHAYPDGCSIYFTLVGASKSAQAVDRHVTLWQDAMKAAIAAGGTISHHHGIGRLRAEALAADLGAGSLSALAAVKAAWDPAGILCPASPLGAAPQHPSSSPPLDSSFLLDEESALVRAPGGMSLDEVERRLAAVHRTLGLERSGGLDVARFVAQGLPGTRDPFSDPVAQRVAGFGALLPGGQPLSLRPAPRRATGPDPSALFVGAGARIGSVEHAWLPAAQLGAPKARALPYAAERAPAVTAGEADACERIVGALGRATRRRAP